MNVIQEIHKFREALNYGYYNDVHRPLFAVTFAEAVDLWNEMMAEEERRYVVLTSSMGRFGGMEMVEIPKPDPLPRPQPGQIWGTVYGIRVYVEEG